ncbi:MAG: hypothetical protein R3E14_09670 [Erythrobacter sp.]
MSSPESPTSRSRIVPALRDRWDAIAPEWRRKALGLLLALGIEALLILLLLSLGIVTREPVPMSDSLVTVTMSSDNNEDEQAEAETAQEPDRTATAPQVPQIRQPEPEAPQPVNESTPVPALIPVSPDAMRTFDIARAATARPTGGAQPVGPANTPRPGDSERIAGSGPNGEPLYAARWYREPREDELRGYLSTVSGPGWALINCRTAPQYRVEDCVLVAESPQGSNMGRAVLAAAWQFKVRPPQIGGRPQVGEWVRIRIVYELRQAPAYPR